MTTILDLKFYKTTVYSKDKGAFDNYRGGKAIRKSNQGDGWNELETYYFTENVYLQNYKKHIGYGKHLRTSDTPFFRHVISKPFLYSYHEPTES